MLLVPYNGIWGNFQIKRYIGYNVILITTHRILTIQLLKEDYFIYSFNVWGKVLVAFKNYKQ